MYMMEFSVEICSCNCKTYEKEICRQNWNEDSQTKSLGGKPCSCEVWGIPNLGTQPIWNTFKIFHADSGAFQLASPCVRLKLSEAPQGTMSVQLNTSTKKRSHKNDSALHPDILSFTPPTYQRFCQLDKGPESPGPLKAKAAIKKLQFPTRPASFWAPRHATHAAHATHTTHATGRCGCWCGGQVSHNSICGEGPWGSDKMQLEQQTFKWQRLRDWIWVLM